MARTSAGGVQMLSNQTAHLFPNICENRAGMDGKPWGIRTPAQHRREGSGPPPPASSLKGVGKSYCSGDDQINPKNAPYFTASLLLFGSFKKA